MIGVCPAAVMAASRAVIAAGSKPLARSQPRLPTQSRRSPTTARMPCPGNATKSLVLNVSSAAKRRLMCEIVRLNAVAVDSTGVSADSRRPARTTAWARGCSERASAVAATRTRSAADRSAQGVTVTTSGTPRVSVPVLSKATTRTVPARSRYAPPLMSTPRREALPMAATTVTGVEMTKRAGAGDQQQDERAVEPRDERLAEHQRGDDGEEDGANDDNGRVDARKPLDKPLTRRFLALRRFDQVDDLRQGVLGERLGRANLQVPMPVDRPGVDGRARRFLDRHRLAGDGRLVYGRVTGDHHPVARNAVAGAHNDDGANHHLLDRLRCLAAVGELHLGGVRRHRHERLDRAPGGGRASSFPALRPD